MALADLNIRIGANIKALDDSLSAADRRLRNFGRKMTDLGAQLSTTFSAAFVAMGVASVKAFGDFERLEKGLGAVTKSVVPVNQQIDRLKTLAEAPGLGFKQAVTASTRLQAVGFSAQFAEKTIKEVANAVATTGGNADNFDSVLKQFTQMISKGKLLQEDLGIIQENMPIVSQAIEKAFGTNNVERIRATGVSAQEFVQKVVGELGGLKRVEGGLSNSLDNLGQSVRFFFVSVGKEINEAFNLQALIDGLSNKLNQVSEWFASLDENVQRNIIRFGVFLAAVGPVLFLVGKMAAIGRVVVAGFQVLTGAVSALGAAFTFLTSPIGLIILAITALSVAGVYLYKNWDSAKAAFTNIWIGIKNFLLNTINAILKGIDSFTSAATFGVAGTNLAEKFSFKTQDYVDVPKWKSFGATMKEVGGDLLQYAGLAGKAKKETKDLNNAVFSGDTGLAIAGGDTASAGGGAGGTGKVERIGQVASIASGGTIDQINKYAGAIQGLTDKHSSLKGQIKTITEESLPQMDVALNSTQERAKRYIEAMAEFARGLESTIKNAITETAVGFGEFLGNLATGATKGRALAGVLLGPIASALEQLGKLAIQTGVAMLAIQKALKFGNPFVAIAAGVALIALSKIVQAGAAKLSAPKLAKGGLAYGETLAVVGDNPNARTDPEVIAPLSKLRSYIDSASGGGGGYSEIFLRGEDLVLAMERTNNRKLGRIK